MAIPLRRKKMKMALQESNAASNGSEADVEDSEGEEQDDKPLAARVAPLVQSRRPKRGDQLWH